MTGSLLIVRRDGSLWGLRAARVSTIERTSGGFEGSEGSGGIALRLAGGGTLAVDSVLTLAAELRVHPLSARLRRLLPAGAGGLALLGGEPLVVLAERTEMAEVPSEAARV